jgi:hypothetical protein
MSNSVFARLISKLRAPNRAPGDDPRDDAYEPESSDRHDDYLFADLLAASVLLDFGGVPADFFQMRSREFIARGAAGKAESK